MPDYINKRGLSTAIDQLQALCLTKAEGVSIYDMLTVLADAVVYPQTSVTIPSSGWTQERLGDLQLYCDVAAEVTSRDGVDVVLDAASLGAAQTCGLCPTVETYDGFMRFRAVSIPESEITGVYRILRGPGQEE